ncbi:MAG TPA: DUF4331 domain-containing protein [Thermoanaerobaculia bacterium]|jgi:hypothetical protein|nr:DUF4331 domain-containing protein [Thermoanaerobaculia bacterium]
MKKLTPIALALLGILAALPATASSHREAPLITETPKVDGTDFYMFNSYEPGRAGFVTLIANYLPLQDAYGGPNYFSLDPDAFYRIHVDRGGDGVEDISFQFKFNTGLRDIQLPVGGKQVSIPLEFAGGVTTPGAATLNTPETYTMWVVRGAFSDPARTTQPITNAVTHSARFAKPLDNVGNKTIPNYAAYASQFIHSIDIPGCGAGRVFVGQRKESFAVNLGEIFDLVNLSNPLGPRDAIPSTLADKNITTIALEVPASCLTSQASTVIGGWTTAALPRNRALKDAPSFAEPETQSGEFVQVSRLGMPLVNEIVIGLKDKNKFNASTPNHDGQFADYVTNPTLPELLEILFGAAGVRAPNNFPRTDLVAAFLTGVTGLNQLGGPAEMQRLNTAIAATPKEGQNNLGVLGGDNAGFPNGRRPGDDVVDAELRVAMGVLCHAFPGVFCSPADAPSGTLPFTDGTLQDASQFDATFPYLTTPIPGSPHEVSGLQ